MRVLALPAEYDPRNTINFEHYKFNSTLDPPVRDVSSSRYYWNVHMLGAYEWRQTRDNDPNNEAWTAGWSEPSGVDDPTNFVFEETVRDLWAEPELGGMVGHQTGLDRVSAHEALHRFFGWHVTDPNNPSQPDPNQPSNQGIMDRTTLMTAATVQLTDQQIRFVQAKDHPE